MSTRTGTLYCLAVLLALAGAGFVVVRRLQRPEPSECRADALFDLWHRELSGRTAGEAAEAWQKTLAAMGGEVGELSLENHRDAYRMLGVLFFAEENYGEAFRMYRQEEALTGATPRGIVLYCASLSGQAQWLRSLREQESPHATLTRSRLLLACEGWASGDPSSVARISWRAETPPGDLVARREVVWLRLLVGRAQLQLRRYQDACESLLLTHRQDIEALEPPVFIAVHLAGLYIEALEQLREYDEALRVAEMIELSPKGRHMKSWQGALGEIDAAAARLRNRISERNQ